MTTRSAQLSLATRPSAWIAIVALASTVLSYGLACAVPFAAVAAISALTLGRRDALLLVGLAWLSNQAVGFGRLNYPWDFETFAWGLGLLAVSVLATLGAELCTSRFRHAPKIAGALLAFLAAFAVYEGALALVTLAVGSGTEVLSWDVVAQIFALNTSAFVVLFAARRLRLPHRRRAAARSAA
jgi:hypothetical protein